MREPVPERRSLDVADDVVMRARAGDDGAFAQFVEHYDEALRRLVYLLLGEPDQLDRILQDAYVKAYRALPQFRRGSSPGTWLFRIVYHGCLDELRRRLRRPARRGVAPSRSSRDAPSTFEQALRRLPADQSAVVVLIDGEGFEHAAVGDVVDLSPASVSNRLIKARAALRAAMAGDEDVYGVVTGTAIDDPGLDGSRWPAAEPSATASADQPDDGVSPDPPADAHRDDDGGKSVGSAPDAVRDAGPGADNGGGPATLPRENGQVGEMTGLPIGGDRSGSWSDLGEPRHDASIGAAVGTIPVPEHGDHFWHALGRRLLAERDAPAAPPFDPIARLEAIERRTDAAAGPVGHDTRGRQAIGPLPQEVSSRPNVTKLAEQADRAHGRRNWRRGVIWAMAIGAGAALVLVAVWLGMTADPKATNLDAAKVASRMSANVNSSDYLLGQVVTTTAAGTVESWAFVRAPDGSYRYRGLNVQSDTAYDAARGSARTWRQNQVGQQPPTIQGFEDVGLATGPPDPDGSGRYLTGDALAHIIRALQKSGTTKPRPTKYEGHEVWEFDVPDAVESTQLTDRLKVMVDKDQLEPVLAVRSSGGRVSERAQFAAARG